MSDLTDYVDALPDHQRQRLTEVFAWLAERYPQLAGSIRWGQPMFTDHGTLIVAFSPAKAHLAVALEDAAMAHFAAAIAAKGYSCGKRFVRLPWSEPFDYDLVGDIIEFNLVDKADVTTFWRPV